MKLLIVGYPGPGHVGRFLYEAAEDLGFDVIIHDMGSAYARPTLIERVRYRLFDRKPKLIDSFSASVVALCAENSPDFVLTTGTAPVLAGDLVKIKELGIKTVNFSTDDPWSRSHKSKWFFASLKKYDLICTPRWQCIEDFKDLGIQNVRYLPFAYDPRTHFVESKPANNKFNCDVLFYGGADRDRADMFTKFVGSGVNLHLYGTYWSRYPQLRSFNRGMLAPNDIPAAISAAKVTICIGRKSNRDLHAMRSFEAPAMAACMMIEDSEDHRNIFGNDPDVVSFFSLSDDIVELSKQLIADPDRCLKMRENALERVTRRPNTYADRLKSIVTFVKEISQPRLDLF